jgi:hypothetical protein
LVTADGVGVTLINPGATLTNFFDADGGPPDRGMLTADQLARCIVWAINQPSGVDVNTMTVRPIGSPCERTNGARTSPPSWSAAATVPFVEERSDQLNEPNCS